MKYRLKKDESGLRRLAGIHRGWFRLAQSADIPNHVGPHNIDTEYSILPSGSVPEPLISIPDAPLTGVRAPRTPQWKMDFVVRFLSTLAQEPLTNNELDLDVCREYLLARRVVWHHVGPQPL